MLPLPSVKTEVPVSISESRLKKFYGPGGFSENLGVNAVAQLVNPVFAIALGISPALVGLAMAIPRLVDAFTDPIMGSISDNWQGKWGRRRPFILWGAILSGLCVALIWWTPQEASKDFQFYWLVAFLLLSTIGTTCYAVPYVALGMESPSTKHERTSWMAWRSFYHKLSGVGVQWLFFLVQLSIFASTLWGARIVGAVVGVVIAALGALPALFIREDPNHVRQTEPVPLLRSWGLTLRDRNFLILAGTSVLIFCSILLVDTLGFFLSVYLVFGGDLTEAAFFKGIGGTMFHVTGILCIPGMAWLAKRIGKLRTFELCTLSIVVGGIAKFFFFVPGAGWLIVVPNFFLAPGLVAVLVLLPSLLADVAAHDEVQQGHSRQGMYAASMTWINKLSISGVAAVSGFILILAGWVQDAGVDQAAGTFEKMRWIFSLGTVGLALAATILLRFYRLDTSQDK